MPSSIGSVALLVKDYEQALNFYIEKLDFVVVEDLESEMGRWLLIAPNKSARTRVQLLKASEQDEAVVGRQAGSSVLMIFETEDFWSDYEKFKQRNVVFLEEPRVEPYGTVVIFEDLYGNKFDLIQPTKP
ncbi:glyoxalase family protein [Vibrio ishigakensis]|uniref:Glyoxalase family protein n=1 Tax=Vibrio ishigakensis TaxID=1481914 RepID=A0A0B8P6T8_9VIBR|nr:VOC family protein [Vibrio ishigakensis]GAM58913.1 glyoxalase family protein [Vibrio ishigakensis]